MKLSLLHETDDLFNENLRDYVRKALPFVASAALATGVGSAASTATDKHELKQHQRKQRPLNRMARTKAIKAAKAERTAEYKKWTKQHDAEIEASEPWKSLRRANAWDAQKPNKTMPH